MSESADTAVLAYGQLLSVGLLWISFHCAGMCGPILIGLDVSGAGRGSSTARGAGHILLYQVGRAITYVFLGGLFGLVGASIESAFLHVGGILSLVFGLVLLGVAIWNLKPKARPEPGELVQGFGLRRPDRLPWYQRFARRAKAALLPLSGGRRAVDSVALGAVMGLMPCMITFWALGLAATTGSPLHGAGVMLLLVAMTTPMLLGVTLLPRLVRRPFRRWAARIPAVLMTISAVWLMLVGAAGLGLIEHAHVGVELGGEHYMIMFW